MHGDKMSISSRIFSRPKRVIDALSQSQNSGSQFQLRIPVHIMKTNGVISLFSTQSTKFETHYDVLGIKRTATTKEIKEAYIRLGKEFHPDLHQNIAEQENIASSINDDEKEKINAKFKAINEAYRVLSRKDSRRMYDLGLPGTDVKDGEELKQKYRQYKSYGTFEERAEAVHGYKVDPNYYDKNPDKNKIAGLCVLAMILGYFVHYQIAKLSARKHSAWLDSNTTKLSQNLQRRRENAEKRGPLEKGEEYDRLQAMLKEEVERNKRAVDRNKQNL